MEVENIMTEENSYNRAGFQSVDDLSDELSRQSRRYTKPFEEEQEASVK